MSGGAMPKKVREEWEENNNQKLDKFKPKTEFDLSEKLKGRDIDGFVHKDIKEFIKKTLKDMSDFRIGRDTLMFRFKKRAGRNFQ